jgi:hypothetical protein
MWRRVAAGLNTSLQNTLFNRLRPVLLPSKNRPFAKPPANEWTEMWRAAASLERLDLKTKEALGDAVLKSIKRPPAPPHAFFSLTRLGARIPLYGPLNSVIHPQQIERWLAELSSFVPAHASDRLAWLFCLAQLARKSGQRAIDVADDSRDRVLELLRNNNAPSHWLEMVDHVSELEADEQRQLFGESLPIGLRLAKPAE